MVHWMQMFYTLRGSHVLLCVPVPLEMNKGAEATELGGEGGGEKKKERPTDDFEGRLDSAFTTLTGADAAAMRASSSILLCARI